MEILPKGHWGLARVSLSLLRREVAHYDRIKRGQQWDVTIMNLNAPLHLHLTPLFCPSSTSTLPIYSSYPLHTHSCHPLFLLSVYSFLVVCAALLSLPFHWTPCRVLSPLTVLSDALAPTSSLPLSIFLPFTKHLFLSPFPLMKPIILEAHFSVRMHVCVCGLIHLVKAHTDVIQTRYICWPLARILGG